MTLEHHRCRPDRDRTGFSSAVHHLLIYHKCTIAPPPSKPPLARGHHCTRDPCWQSRRAATSPALPPPVSPTAAEDLARRPSSTSLGCVSSHHGHRPRRLAPHSYRPCLLRLVGCRPSLLRRADHPPRWPSAHSFVRCRCACHRRRGLLLLRACCRLPQSPTPPLPISPPLADRRSRHGGPDPAAATPDLASAATVAVRQP